MLSLFYEANSHWPVEVWREFSTHFPPADWRGAAGAALSVGPFSVTHKNRLAPSGKPHDYVSQAPYVWPNPDTPDGLPYVTRDGERNHAEVARYDRPKMVKMAHAVQNLALAFHLSAESRYAERAALLLRVWFLDDDTRMNPHLEYAQAIPGVTSGRHYGIIEACHLLAIPGAVELLGECVASEKSGLQKWFGAFLEWLRDSEKGREQNETANNHGTWYDAQVALFALFCGQDEVARRVLEEVGAKRIARQIAPDGAQPHELKRTLSLNYSLMNLHGFFWLAILGRRVGVPVWEYESEGGASLARAVAFLQPYTEDASAWPYPQIAPVSAEKLRVTLRAFERFCAPLP